MAQYSDEMVRQIYELNGLVMSLDSLITSFHDRDALCQVLSLRLKGAYLQGRVDAFTEAIGVEGE